MTGFCGETEEEHLESLSMLETVMYDYAFMFKYSERPGTWASKHLKDDVPEPVKVRRLNEIIALQSKISEKTKKQDIGKVTEILVEGVSKKSKTEFFGRTSGNKVVVFPDKTFRKGEIIRVEITGCTSATLKGKIYEG